MVPVSVMELEMDYHGCYSVRKGSAVLFPLKMNGQNLEFVIDTGSAVTIISRDAFKGLPGEKPDLIVKELPEFKTANEGCLVMDGVAEMSCFEDGEMDYNWDIHVAPIPVHGLLGMDFLNHHDYHLGADGSLVLDGRTVQCEVRVLGRENGESSLRLVREMVIPIQSEVVTEGQLESGSLYGSGLALVGPASMRAPDAGILAGHCLNDTSSGDVPQKVMNTSSEDVFMCEGMSVTFKSRVREDSIDSQPVLASVSKDSTPECGRQGYDDVPFRVSTVLYADKQPCKEGENTKGLVRTYRSICFMLLCMLVQYATLTVLQCKKLCNFASKFSSRSVQKITYCVHATASPLTVVGREKRCKCSKTKASADGPGPPCTVAYVSVHGLH